MTNIFFQNGMNNNIAKALESAKLIKQTTGAKQDVGLIINQTGDIVNDIGEFIKPSLTLTDALNGEVYQQLIEKNPNNKTLLITHSAGNKDLERGAKILKANGVNLNNQIEVFSIGSPLSKNRLNKTLTDVGINLIGQYNNILDPVTNPKSWGVGATGLAIGAGIYGASSGIGMVTTGTGLEALFTGLIGGGIGGGIGAYNLKIQHPLEKYVNKDFKNVKTDMTNWVKNNPVK
jgi:hypothetical protein